MKCSCGNLTPKGYHVKARFFNGKFVCLLCGRCKKRITLSKELHGKVKARAEEIYRRRNKGNE